MYLLSIFFPFLSFLNLVLFGKVLGQKVSTLISCFFLFCSWFCSFFILFEVIFSLEPTFLIVSNWFTTFNFTINWIFLFDFLSAMMLFVITSISFFVHVFSYYYMKNDPHSVRFFSFLSIFTFFMIFLVTAGSFLQLILGWEGVGLTSFLLINFWYTRIEANKSALKAIFVNRVGDCCLIIAMVMLLTILGSFDFVYLKYIITFFLKVHV